QLPENCYGCASACTARSWSSGGRRSRERRRRSVTTGVCSGAPSAALALTAAGASSSNRSTWVTRARDTPSSGAGAAREEHSSSVNARCHSRATSIGLRYALEGASVGSGGRKDSGGGVPRKWQTSRELRGSAAWPGPAIIATGREVRIIPLLGEPVTSPLSVGLTATANRSALRLDAHGIESRAVVPQDPTLGIVGDGQLQKGIDCLRIARINVRVVGGED